jgi:hypothetical protein
MSLNTEGDKWIAKIMKYDREMPDNIENMDSEELKARVLQSQMNLLENDRNMKQDSKLSKAKMKAKELEKPYKEAKEFQEAIVQYGMLILEERGVPLSE